jgi:hypothetical protein
MKLAASLIVDVLAGGLYQDYGQCLNELLRNAEVASMKNGKWEPANVSIEIMLVPNHPLCKEKGGLTLIVLDHGSGLTPDALSRYFEWVGRPISVLEKELHGRFGGASQKMVGRFATFALSKFCANRKDLREAIRHGFFVQSRTESWGRVRSVEVIPERIELDGGVNVDRFIDPFTDALGPLKNIKGSFTAIVIPSPVFTSGDEIYEAVKWYLPRGADKMYKLSIDGKRVSAPPLVEAHTATSLDGQFRAHLAPASGGSGGLWLCDAETGYRVANCQKLAHVLPDPLGSSSLSGDIFAPGLLAHQNTERSTLHPSYTKKGNKPWEQLLMFLIREVVPAAKAMVDAGAGSGDANRALSDVLSLFNERYAPKKEEKREGSGNSGSGGGGFHTRGENAERENGSGGERMRTLHIRNETFRINTGRTLGAFVFAQVDPNDGKSVLVNVGGAYKGMPTRRAEQLEHVMLQIVFAIGANKNRNSPLQAMKYAAEVLSELR